MPTAYRLKSTGVTALKVCGYYLCEWATAFVSFCDHIDFYFPHNRVQLPARHADVFAGDGPSPGVQWSEAATQGSSRQSQRGTKKSTPGGDGEE